MNKKIFYGDLTGGLIAAFPIAIGLLYMSVLSAFPECRPDIRAVSQCAIVNAFPCLFRVHYECTWNVRKFDMAAGARVWTAVMDENSPTCGQVDRRFSVAPMME